MLAVAEKKYTLAEKELIYQPTEVLKSVLYLYNTFITTIKHRWYRERHMMNQSSSQVAFSQAEVDNNI